MEGVKRDADRKQNIEVRRLINDSHAREKPLEILKQKISVFEKTEHAQIHADAGDEPSLLVIMRFADLASEPEIHRRGGKKERGEWRIPRAIENVTCDDEKIFSKIPTAQVPIEGRDDDVENDEGERIKKHDEGFRITPLNAAVRPCDP